MTSPRTASAGDYMNRNHVLAPLSTGETPVGESWALGELP